MLEHQDTAAPLLTSEQQLLDDAVLTQAVGVAIEQAIAQHLRAGHPVYYSQRGQLCMRLPNGDRFAYRREPDGTRRILYPLPRA